MKTNKSDFGGIFSCFVLFNPDEEHHIDAISNLLTAGSKVVVFDNSDKPDIAQRNRALLAERFKSNVEYLCCDRNLGLSVAFNLMVEHVLSNPNVEALVLFDQDSTVSAKMFIRLVEGYRSASLKHKVGVYAAYAVRVNGKGYRVRPVDRVQTDSPSILPVKFAPSSFSLIPVTTLREIGLFQEDFFIDHIDHDYCLRCWSAGRVVLIDKDLRFPHRIGNGDLSFFGHAIMPISSPFRHYYQTRNIILSHRRNSIPLFLTLYIVGIKVVKVSVLGVFANNFLNRISFSFRGIIDGFCGKGGRMV